MPGKIPGHFRITGKRTAFQVRGTNQNVRTAVMADRHPDISAQSDPVSHWDLVVLIFFHGWFFNSDNQSSPQQQQQGKTGYFDRFYP